MASAVRRCRTSRVGVTGRATIYPEAMAAGLRERKKEATRQALHEAAVRLAVEHGLDNVTVEAIADAATVSRRTFSNYFANKEDALLHGDDARTRLLLELIRQRPAAEPAWTAMSRAAEELLAASDADPVWVTQLRLLGRHPSLLTRRVAHYTAVEREVAASVAGRLRDERSAPDEKATADDPGATGGVAATVGTVTTVGAADDAAQVELRARLLAAALLSCLRLAMQLWIDRPDEPLPDVLHRVLEAAGQQWT